LSRFTGSFSSRSIHAITLSATRAAARALAQKIAMSSRRYAGLFATTASADACRALARQASPGKVRERSARAARLYPTRLCRACPWDSLMSE
jgi:hypothetical protein